MTRTPTTKDLKEDTKEIKRLNTAKSKEKDTAKKELNKETKPFEKSKLKNLSLLNFIRFFKVYINQIQYKRDTSKGKRERQDKRN